MPASTQTTVTCAGMSRFSTATIELNCVFHFNALFVTMLRSKTAGSARCRELRLSDVNSGFCSHLTNLDGRELVLQIALSLGLEPYTEGTEPK